MYQEPWTKIAYIFITGSDTRFKQGRRSGKKSRYEKEDCSLIFCVVTQNNNGHLLLAFAVAGVN